MKKRAESTVLTLIAVVGLLLIFSFTFYLLYKNRQGQTDEENYYTYNGFAFVKQGPLWMTQVQSGNRIYTVPLHYGPRDLTEVKMEGTLSNKFADASYVFITVDPEVAGSASSVQVNTSGETGGGMMALAAGELSIVLSQAISRIPVAACTRNDSNVCNDRPIVQCWGEGEPVIYLRNVDEPRVIFYGDCIEVGGEGDGVVKAVDRLLLFWLGVMPATS